MLCHKNERQIIKRVVVPGDDELEPNDFSNYMSLYIHNDKKATLKNTEETNRKM